MVIKLIALSFIRDIDNFLTVFFIDGSRILSRTFLNFLVGIEQTFRLRPYAEKIFTRRPKEERFLLMALLFPLRLLWVIFGGFILFIFTVIGLLIFLAYIFLPVLISLGLFYGKIF